MRRITTLTILALFTVAPAASAAWGSLGSHEPSTLHDTGDGWMWKTPDIAVVKGTVQLDPANVHKVYFNGFVAQSGILVGTGNPMFNPNLAQLKTDMQGEMFVNYALLGVWKDCNKDGYMGFGDQGLLTYRSELLANTFGLSICKPQSAPPLETTGRLPVDWFPVHNDGTWVQELVPIQWAQSDYKNPNRGDLNAWNLNDNESRVWLDDVLPETDLSPSGGSSGSCTFSPQPKGTFHSTGGLLRYEECVIGAGIPASWNNVAGGGGFRISAGYIPFGLSQPAQVVNMPADLDTTTGQQVTFKDNSADPSKSNSILNVKNPWGEDSDKSYADMWDCTNGNTAVAIPDAGPNEPIPVTNVSTPRTSPALHTDGSVSGTANETGAGTDECHRSTDTKAEHRSRTLANAPYTTESDAVVNDVVYKTQPTQGMLPVESNRPAVPLGAVAGRNTPPNFGVSQLGSLAAQGGAKTDGVWAGNGLSTCCYEGIPRTSVNRVTITGLAENQTTNQFGVTGSGRNDYVYYAKVSPGAVAKYALSMPKASATGVYGAEACGTPAINAPPMRGWACNPNAWYTQAATNGGADIDIEPRSKYLGPGADTLGIRVGTRVGATYNLRDFDCYDNLNSAIRAIIPTDCPYSDG